MLIMNDELERNIVVSILLQLKLTLAENLAEDTGGVGGGGGDIVQTQFFCEIPLT